MIAVRFGFAAALLAAVVAVTPATAGKERQLAPLSPTNRCSTTRTPISTARASA